MSHLRRTVGAAVAVGALLTVGCVDKEKCDEAIRVTREALSKEQPDIARQWRDRAWKICNDSALTSALDKELTDRETQIAKRVADSAKQVADAAQQRLNQATSLWKAFDHEDEKLRTAERLDQFKTKAAQLTQGLPPEYAKQIEDYNESQYARRLTAIEAAAKK